MSDTITKINDLLTEAAETHLQVYRITDGTDEDWACTAGPNKQTASTRNSSAQTR